MVAPGSNITDYTNFVDEGNVCEGTVPVGRGIEDEEGTGVEGGSSERRLGRRL